MLISPAYAQAGGGGGGDILVSLLPIILIFVVFYFLLIRPQQKKVKQHRAMIEALRRGDRVVTSGGIVGQVTKIVSDGEVEVEIAQGTRVRVIRHTITDVLEKTEPATRSKARKEPEEVEEPEAEVEGEPETESETAEDGKSRSRRGGARVAGK